MIRGVLRRSTSCRRTISRGGKLSAVLDRLSGVGSCGSGGLLLLLLLRCDAGDDDIEKRVAGGCWSPNVQTNWGVWKALDEWHTGGDSGDLLPVDRGNEVAHTNLPTLSTAAVGGDGCDLNGFTDRVYGASDTHQVGLTRRQRGGC